MSEREDEDESIQGKDVILPDHLIEDVSIFGQLSVLSAHRRREMTDQVIGECAEMRRETAMT